MQALFITLHKNTNNKQYYLVDLTPYMGLTVHSSKVLSKKSCLTLLNSNLLSFLVYC